MKMRIFAGGISTETNTFSSVPTSLSDFSIVRGSELVGGPLANASLDLSRIWGKMAGARAAHFAFSLMAWAEPSGVTLRSSYEDLRDELLRDLQARCRWTSSC